MIKLIDLLFENKTFEIKNIDYYQKILNMNNNISHSTAKYFQDIINSVKKQNNISTERQYLMLQRLKNGDFKYNTKN